MKKGKYIERQSLLCHHQSDLLTRHDSTMILEDIYEATGRLSCALTEMFGRLDEDADMNWEDIYQKSQYTQNCRGRVIRIMWGFIEKHGGV